MGRVFEEPISDAAKAGFNGLNAFMKNMDGRTKLFNWLSLIFLKTHLKDLSLRENRDRRLPPDQIGDRYDWADIHHIQCVARSFLSGAVFDPTSSVQCFYCRRKLIPVVTNSTTAIFISHRACC